MKAKIISIAMFILLAIVMPFTGSTELLPTEQVGIPVVLVFVLLGAERKNTAVILKADHLM